MIKLEESVFTRIASEKEIEGVKKLILEKYGFMPPDEYIVDLINFVSEITARTRRERRNP